ELLVQLVREVVLERPAVDRERPAARGEAHAGDRLLAPAHGRTGDVEHARGAGLLRGLGRRRLGRVVLHELRGERLFDLRHAVDPYWATWVRAYGFGCCAACGCSGPAYTLSLRNWARPREFFGSIPRTAFSTARVGCFSSSST